MSRKFLRVAKVGGSLFDFPDLPTNLWSWLDVQPGVTVLIAGGGPFVEAIRLADATFTLGDPVAHRLAIRAMEVSAETLAAILPRATMVHSRDEVRQRASDGGLMVFNPIDVLNVSANELPRNWDVTSDSIAAYLAGQLEAHELVLFKSTSLPANASRVQAVDAGLVDGHFIKSAARYQTIRWVNLRSNPITERPL